MRIERFRTLAAILCLLISAPAIGAGPRSPIEERATFALADPALAIELVAAEPEVASPVAIAWDEKGRMYVAEMLDYPTAATAGRIRCLEDRDGDGRYEHATIFADGLPFPNGVLPCYGGVLVTAAPSIWYFRDRDGDGRAEERHVLLTGFAEGNTQLRVNGLTWGLDNWIYVANGRSGGAVRRPSDPADQAISIGRNDMRFRLYASLEKGAAPLVVAIEAIAGFSQFGLPRDDWGNRFPSWNTVPVRHVALEQSALDRNPYLAETESVAEILDMADGGRVYGVAPPQARFNRESVAYFNATCGPIIERGGLLPEEYHGNVFVCESLANLVHRRVLEPAGLTFQARRAEREKTREFLTSTDTAFRPVNLANGPDGALYVVDMYRELVEHPQFVPEPARDTVDFRRWHDRGRIWRIRPKVEANEKTKTKFRPVAARMPDLASADDRLLVALLGNRNGWRRDTAQRLLLERWDTGRARGLKEPMCTPLLRVVLRSSTSPLARLHALWTLQGMRSLGAKEIGGLIEDPNPILREHVLRAARDLAPIWISTETLIAHVDDPAVRVRLQVALELGDRCAREPAALKALARLAERDAGDRWMRLAVLSGLSESASTFVPLCEAMTPSEGRARLLRQAAAIVGARGRAPDLAELLRTVAARAERSNHSNGPGGTSDALGLLSGMADGLERSRSGRGLSAWMASAPAELKGVLDQLTPLWKAARALAVAPEAPPADRRAALDVLARGRPELAEAIVPGLLTPDAPAELKAAVFRAVARIGRSSLARALIDRWDDFSQADRRELLAALSGSPALAAPLVEALERGTIAPRELDAAARSALHGLNAPALRTRAAAVLAKFAPPERSAVLERYRPALALAGDPKRGESVFIKNCQTCHQYRGQGHRVGPDLSGVVGRAPEALLSDVLAPNRNVEPDFIAVAVATKAGQVLSGLIVEETVTTIKLRRAEGVEETLLRSQVEEVRSTGLSLMPEGLEQSIDEQEMADLIAFLRRGG